MTPKQRQLRARIAGLTTHAKGKTNTGPATAAAEARYANEVRAEATAAGETLSDEEVARRALAKRKLFYARLAFASAKARSEKARKRRPTGDLVLTVNGEMRVVPVTLSSRWADALAKSDLEMAQMTDEEYLAHDAEVTRLQRST